MAAPQHKPATAANVADVVKRLGDFLTRQPESVRTYWAADINGMLDRAVDEDSFGPGGVADPRRVAR